MRFSGLTALTSIAALSVAATIVAQEAPQPSSEAKKAELPPSFDSMKALREYFEPRHGELVTAWEDLERKEKTEEKEFDALRQKESDLWKTERDALQTYLKDHPDADDAIEAHNGVIVISSRLGEWSEAVAQADAFLLVFSQQSEGIARIVRYTRADALLHIEGKEKEAARAFEDVISLYPGTLEERKAQELLIVAYTYLDRIADAKKLVRDMLESDAVRDDDGAKEYFEYELEKLDMNRSNFPDFKASKRDGSAVNRNDVVDQPTLIWYWDSQSPTSLASLPTVAATAKTFKDKLKVVAMSVDKSRDAWEQEAEKLESQYPEIMHLHEGTSGEDRSAPKLTEQMPLPLALLVGSDQRIHRYDVAGFELDRVVRAWLK